MVNHRESTDLSRRLGLTATVMTGLGVIIGSGIYVILGISAGQAGNAVWLSFLIAAVGASFTAFSYARLSRLKPKNAPEYHYVGTAFGELSGFFAGWLILIAQVGSATAVALGFAGYFSALTDLPEIPAAAVLILVNSLIIYIGIGQSALIASILTAVEVLGLLIIIGIGSAYLGDVDYLEMPLGITGVFSGASLVFFAFLGFEGMANLAEEMKDPVKNLPKAILLALGITTFFYILVAFSAVSVLGWNELSQSSAPFALIAERALGPRAGMILAVISLASTGNTTLILLLAGSRITHALSKARVFPAFFSNVDRSRKTPWLAILVIGLLAIVLTLLAETQRVAEFTNFTTLLAFIAVNASALRLLVNRDNNRLKHYFLNRLLPALGILFSLWLAVNAGWQAALFGLAVLAAGALFYLVSRLLRNKTGTGS